MFSLISFPSTQQRGRLSPPLDLDIECEEHQTSSVPRSVDGLAHVGPTSSLRRSLLESTVAQSHRRSVRRFTLGHAPDKGTSKLRSKVRCSTRSCGMALRDLQEPNESFVCEQPSSLCSQCRTTHNAAPLLVANSETQVAQTFTVEDSLLLVLGPAASCPS